MRRLKCDSCGAVLKVDKNQNSGICQFCGSEYLLEERVNVKVTIDNKSEEKIKIAKEYLEKKDYEKADKIFKEVLEKEPENYEGLWGRYLCETYYSKFYGYKNKYGETNITIKKDIILKNLEYANKAISLAPDDIKEIYKSVISDDLDFVNNNLFEKSNRFIGKMNDLIGKNFIGKIIVKYIEFIINILKFIYEKICH